MLCCCLNRLLIWVCITAAGGILLWVNGVMGPVRYRMLSPIPGLPGFTGFFLLWLLEYGLCGFLLGICLLPCGTPNHKRCSKRMRNAGTAVMAYLFLLAWYPLFFSIFHGFLSALVLSAAVCCHLVVLYRCARGLFLMVPLCFLTIMGEFYFLYVTISSNLLN